MRPAWRSPITATRWWCSATPTLRTIDSLVYSGLRPTFVSPELDPELGIAHCLTPEALDAALTATPRAAGAWVISPTYFGAAADMRGLADVAHEHGVALIVDEAWGAHMAFHEELPEHALAAGADLVISSTHKIVGSLTQSAMLHLGHDARIGADTVDRAVTLTESTSPNSLLFASLDAARRQAVVAGHDLLERTMAALAQARAEIREIEGLDVLDERLVGRPGVFAYDPLRLAVDVRGLDATRLRAGAAAARDRRHQPRALRPERARRRVRDGRAPLPEAGAPGGGAARGGARGSASSPTARSPFAAPPPWGELAMTPREAYLGSQEVVPAEHAIGRIAAESLATYPPGIPNVLPGERLTAETLAYIRGTLELGGSIRGASDRQLRTVRVVVE